MPRLIDTNAGGGTSLRGFEQDRVGPIDPLTGLPTGGRFIVLLPHTAGSGGGVVADRLVGHLARQLGVTPDAVFTRTLALPEDGNDLTAFRDSIAATRPDYDEVVSGT